MSGFEIFPSLLGAAGYDYQDIRAHYHRSVFDDAAGRAVSAF